MPSAGRKFLMAGRGGLNLTHSERHAGSFCRAMAPSEKLRDAIEAFPPSRLRAWADELGAETFVGSSGRVFPKAMKASPLLRAWLRRLDAAGVRFALRHKWSGWDEDGRLTFTTPSGGLADHGRRDHARARRRKLATPRLGWRLGGDSRRGPALPSRRSSHRTAGFLADWSEHFTRHAGQPLSASRCRSGTLRARRDHRHGNRHRRRRDLRAVAAAARCDRGERRGNTNIALRPDVAADELAASSRCRAESNRFRRSCARR